MEFDFSPGALINAGGALLFLLAGLAILAVARHTRLGLRLGAFAATFGFAYVVENFVDYGADSVSAIVLLIPGTAAAICLAFLIVEILRDVPKPARRKVAILAAAIGLVVATVGVVYVARQLEEPGLVSKVGGNSVAGFPLTWLNQPFLLVLLAAASQVPSGTASVRVYKGRLLLGLATGLFAVDIVMVGAALINTDQSWKGPVVDFAGLLLGTLVALTAWLVLRGRPTGGEAFARRAYVAILIMGLAGCVQQAFPEKAAAIGPYGIIRSVGAVLLVLAVVRYDILGVALPKVAVRRGALAGGALATLFIVAQVAQNFFSAEYGLLTGGIIAGTFLFAASPVQKAIERMGEGKRNPAGKQTPQAESAFRNAVALAYKDRHFTPKEELALADLAEQLGLGARRATEIRHEVEGG